MFLVGLGAVLVLGGVLYMARSAISGGSLSGRVPPGRFAALWSRHDAAWDSWGFGPNWPGILLMVMALCAVLLGGVQFLASASR